MKTQKERTESLSNLNNKITRKKYGYDDVSIKLKDVVDQSTGEITTVANAEYPPEKYVINRKTNKENIRKKAIEPFIRISRDATFGLENNEKLVYYLLTELVSFENNFITDDIGNFLSVSQLSTKFGIGRKHLSLMLSALESKERLKIVDGGNIKAIYLYSKYVWFGFEKNKNDSKLTNISRFSLTAVQSHYTSESNINKERADLQHNKYPPLSHQDSVIESSGLSQGNNDSDIVSESTGLNATVPSDVKAVLDNENTTLHMKVNTLIVQGNYDAAIDLLDSCEDDNLVKRIYGTSAQYLIRYKLKKLGRYRERFDRLNISQLLPELDKF